MKFSIKMLIASGMAAAALTATGGAASAVHCADSGPGNSDFAAHVLTFGGAGGHNEGDHQGWSSCEPQAKSGGR